MLTHLTDESLIDLAEGTAGGESSRHAAECGSCGARLQQVTAGLELARCAEVPEPSPLYWEHFRRQLGRRLEAAEPRRRPHLVWGPLLAAAAAALAVAVWVPGTLSDREPRTAPHLAAWSALPPSDSDEGLAVLAAVAPQAAEALGVVTDCRDLGSCLAELSDEEGRVLTEALRGQLAKGGTS